MAQPGPKDQLLPDYGTKYHKFIIQEITMNLTFTIDPNTFAVSIYKDNEQIPIIYQPDWPNATPWNSSEEATTWAQLCIQAIVDDNAPYAPAGPGLPGEPKPLPQTE